MAHSARWLVALVALAALMAPICRANPINVEDEELKLMEKYEKILDQEHEAEEEEEEEEGKGAKSAASPEHESRYRQLVELLHGFSALNGQLESQLPNSADVDKNLELAADFLASQQQGEAKQQQAALQSATECFLLLGQIHKKENMCNSFSDTILRLNVYLAGGLAKSARLAKLVGEISAEHARGCQGTYAIRYKEQLDKLDEGERAHLLGLMSDGLVAVFMASNPSTMVDLMHGVDGEADGVDSGWRTKLASRIYRELKSRAMGDPQLEFVEKIAPGHWSINDQKFRSAYAQLLVAPCRSFVDQLGPAVFSPAKFDMGVSRAPLLKASLSADEIAFVFGLFRYEVCKMVVEDKRNAFATDVKRAINN